MMKSYFPQGSWQTQIEELVRVYGFERMKLKDAAAFGLDGTIESWVRLLAALCKRESNFKPTTTYKEVDMEGQISTGLYQMSYSSVRAYAKFTKDPEDIYVLKSATTEKLKNPSFNISCMMFILNHWLVKDGCVSGKNGKQWLGMARYWSPARKPGLGDQAKALKPTKEVDDTTKKLSSAEIKEHLAIHGFSTVKEFQRAKGLEVDGIVGPITTRALLGEPVEKPASIAGDHLGASWVFANIDLLGRKEGDPLLEARYVPEWKLEGLGGYKTLVGNRHAWCSLRENADKRKVKVKGTNSAGAASWSKWGRKCPFWFGATLDIKHRSGGRHVCTFLYWIDEKKKLCATLDGNRSNQFGVFETDLSGRGDTLVTGPRWSNDVPDGQFVSKAEVLKRYPFLKVGGKGSGTT